jgi:hypothetical protein
MKYVSSSRRQLVMAVLLGLAVIGAAMRYAAPNPSLARDIGTLLLVLWLPAVGNLVGFVVRKIPARPKPATGFAQGQPFTAHVSVQITPTTLDAGSAPLDQGERQCTVVIGSEGFRARTAPPLAQALASGDAVELELLRPALALQHLTPGTAFRMLAGSQVVASGRVLGP